MQTEHYHFVKEFMLNAGQACPEIPTMPSEKDRILRAKLIFEEAIEKATALGLTISLNGVALIATDKLKKIVTNLEFNATHKPDFIGMIDGAADVSVVNTGDLIAMGMHDGEILAAVDENNLFKFGHGGYRDADGKWIKPKNHPKPDFLKIVKQRILACCHGDIEKTEKHLSELGLDTDVQILGVLPEEIEAEFRVIRKNYMAKLEELAKEGWARTGGEYLNEQTLEELVQLGNKAHEAGIMFNGALAFALIRSNERVTSLWASSSFEHC